MTLTDIREILRNVQSQARNARAHTEHCCEERVWSGGGVEEEWGGVEVVPFHFSVDLYLDVDLDVHCVVDDGDYLVMMVMGDGDDGDGDDVDCGP